MAWDSPGPGVSGAVAASAAGGAFRALTAGGDRQPAEFVEAADGRSLFHERCRLNKQ